MGPKYVIYSTWSKGKVMLHFKLGIAVDGNVFA